MQDNLHLVSLHILVGTILFLVPTSVYAQVQVQQSQSSTINGHTHKQSFHCFGLGCTNSPSSKEFKAGYHKLFEDWNAVCPNGAKNSSDFCTGFLQGAADLSNK